MVYYRRRYKKRPTRRYRRKGSKFTKFNTYKYRSSKAQAGQIYSLNKKVNYMYKQVKPRIHFADSDKYELNNLVIPTTGDHPGFDTRDEFFMLFGSSFNCRFDGDRDDANKTYFNNYISNLSGGVETLRLKSGCVYFTISKDSAITPNNFNGIAGIDIYVLQYKQAQNFNNSNGFFGPTTQYNFRQTDLYKPLNSGCWQYVKVLRHRRILLNNLDVGSKTFKLKYKPYYKTLKSIKTDSSGTGNTDTESHSICLAFRTFAQSEDTDAKLSCSFLFRQYFTQNNN